MSVTNNSTATPPETQSKSIDITGRQYSITRLTERCWLLTDDVTLVTRQFQTSEALWAEVKRMELTPDQNLDLPQLPSRVPTRRPSDTQMWRGARRNRVAFQSKHGKRYPTRGVIALPASMTPEQSKPAPKAPQLTKAQQKVADDFLDEATKYFTLLSKIDNLKNKREWHDTKWHLTCAFERMSGRAFTYAQLVGLGM